MDDALFRTVMASTPAPVTVITAYGEHGPAGTTVSAFISLSLTPWLVVVALNRTSTLIPQIQTTARFGVNILAAGQAEVAMQFASPVADRFEGTDWWPQDDLPRLGGTAAWLSCRLATVLDAGDHELLVGEVVAAAHAPKPPMVYAGRLFGGHSELTGRPSSSLAEQLLAAR